MSNLDTVLANPGQTPIQISNTASGISLNARDYRNRYWQTKDSMDGTYALRFYAGYLTLSSPQDPMAPFYLMESIAIYCDLGCADKANQLASELSSQYTYNPDNLTKVLAFCRVTERK
jgi:hypothetical protein